MNFGPYPDKRGFGGWGFDTSLDIAAKKEKMRASDEKRLADVVFTVPHKLNVLARENARLFYDLICIGEVRALRARQGASGRFPN